MSHEQIRDRDELASPRSVPTLDELAAHPERATELPAGVARQLYVQVAALKAALAATLLASPVAAPVRPPHGDRFVGPAEVAVKIGKSRSWVEKHAAELPPRRRVGGEGLWSERELEAWIRARPRWGEG